jgi:hypothetical protein
MLKRNDSAQVAIKRQRYTGRIDDEACKKWENK